MTTPQHRAALGGTGCVILGAGLAGLSLADALLTRGVTSPITLIDVREEFPDDRTWCFWDVHPHPYRHLVSHRWACWSFSGHGATHRQRSASAPYCHLPARRFYEDVLSRLSAAPNCTLVLGTTVQDVRGQPGTVRVRTSAGEVTAAHCFDALATAGPTWARLGPATGEQQLSQRFLGWFVRAPRPVFDPSCMTLMDFDVTPNGELRFMYVLPFSTTSALVEDTSIGFYGVPADASRDEIRRYLGARFGLHEVEVLREEESVLPMVSARPPRGDAAAPVIAVGNAAGAVRPSSGYAFIRTQRHVARLADAFARGRPGPVPVERPREARLDAVFLEALRDDPPGFANHLLSLGRRMPGDRFARFMMDAASPADVLAMVAALPKGPFARAAARSIATGRMP